MENNGEQSSEESPMYSDSYLLPILQELNNKVKRDIGYFSRDLLLKIAEDCITRATGTIEQGSKDALLEGGNKGIQNDFLKLANCSTWKANIFQAAWYGRFEIVPLGRLCHQITCEILNGNDTHSITLNVLKNHLAKSFWWDKAAITLAAFALTFGDLWLLVRIYAHNVVNEPVTTDQRELTSANKEAYINQIEANNEFIKNLVKSLPYLFDIQYSSFGYADMTNDQQTKNILKIYWIVRCAIVAATQIIVLSSRGLDQYLVGIRTPAEVGKLKSLTEELMCTLSKLREGGRAVNTIDTKISNKVDDVVEIMKVLITDEDMPPLYHGETKRKDHLDVLRGKRVLLLISGMNITFEDITSLKHVTIDTEKDEIVWIPVINRSIAELDDSVKNHLETLQNSMPWYSVQPSMVTDDAIYFFELRWDFKGTPICVILSPSGNIVRYNAIHMMRIWQNLSVDDLITYDTEIQLWEKETWNLKLLVNDIIEPIMQKWIEDKRYIILYGGSDIDWIRSFTRQAQSVASDLQARIEMVYMGNGQNKDLGRQARDMILIEQLSRCLPESSMLYFWTRFDSMMIKLKDMLGYKQNLLLREMLRFRHYEEWVLLARGSTILFNGPGQSALNVLKIWRDGGESCYIIRGFI